MTKPTGNEPRPRAVERTVCRASLLTPPGRGAVATIVVRGTAALPIVDQLFHAARRRPLSALPVDRIWFGQWAASVGDQGVGNQGVGGRQTPAEDVVVVRRGKEALEVHCHGGNAAPRRILADLEQSGCQIEDPWRELRLGSDPLIAAAAVALAQTRTRRTAAILLDQYQGALSRAVRRVGECVDRSDAPAARAELQSLCDRASVGTHLVRPWRVVLAGAPNVGKSSLINAALGYHRVIVFHQPGTTRDAILAGTALDGWPVELVDTAGLRESDCPIEVAGMVRSRDHARSADLVVLVFDGSRSWNSADQQLWRRQSGALTLHNKCDLPLSNARDRPHGMWVSAETGQGVEQWLHAIVERLVPNPTQPGEAVPFTSRQVGLLNTAFEAAQRRAWPEVMHVLRQLESGAANPI